MRYKKMQAVNLNERLETKLQKIYVLLQIQIKVARIFQRFAVRRQT